MAKPKLTPRYCKCGNLIHPGFPENLELTTENCTSCYLKQMFKIFDYNRNNRGK